MPRLHFLFLFLSATFVVKAQSFRYDKDLLSKEFHKGRREALRNLMRDSSVTLVFANAERNRANDVNFQYHQDPDFYYLTGITEPNAVLLIFKNPEDFGNHITDELIFLQDLNPQREAWTGKRIGIEGAVKHYGINSAFVNTQFADFNIDFKRFKKIYHSPLKDDVRDDKEDRGDLYSLIRHFRLKTDSEVKNMDPFKFTQMMAGLREIKLNEEITLMRKAINITVDGHRELMKALEPGMMEYQAQAILEYYFKRGGSEYPGYPSIVGGGENSCILHYISNRKQLNGENMLVVDAGAEYHGYTADITRTLPTDGKFSLEEKAIYNLVLKAQNEGIMACKEGNDFRDPHKAAQAVIEQGLLDLGITKDKKEYQRYFFHGTSHYLGLDVHDAGLFEKLRPGNVITVEPGIYISEGSPCDPKWWNIGVRIEDDILITQNEPENLSVSLPRTVEEIEILMKENSILNSIHKK